MDGSRARRRADQLYGVFDEARGEERLAFAGAPERHEGPTGGDVLRRETRDLVRGGVERRGLTRLGLAVETWRDRGGWMLIRRRGDRKGALPASVERVRGRMAAVLASAARKLPDEAVRRSRSESLVDLRGDLRLRIRVDIVRWIAVDEHGGDHELSDVIGGDRGVCARRQIGFVGGVRVRRQLRAQMTRWQHGGDGETT